jgi:uncharacterized phage protein (TIGR01671 family)
VWDFGGERMRELKFRAWDKKEGLWREDLSFNLRTNKIEWNNFDEPAPSNDDIELMQYTGLKDKNGKEIYEGDILKMRYNDEEPLVVVTFEWATFSGTWIDTLKEKFPTHTLLNDRTLEKSEVIGNKFENPELMK